MKQGDNLSPKLFAMYLNDLAVEVKSLNCGIDIDGRQVTILLYADDIVPLAPNESSLQKQLDAIYNWCRKWRMKVNTKDEKTEIVHFRPKGTPLTKSTFFYGSCELKIVQCYKYLGTYIVENLSLLNILMQLQLRVQESWVGSAISYTILKNVEAPHLLSYIYPVYVPFSITAQLFGETRNLSKLNKSNCELYGIFWASTVLPPHQCCWVTRAG